MRFLVRTATQTFAAVTSHFKKQMHQYDSEFSLLEHVHSQLGDRKAFLPCLIDIWPCSIQICSVGSIILVDTIKVPVYTKLSVSLLFFSKILEILLLSDT